LRWCETFRLRRFDFDPIRIHSYNHPVECASAGQ
jgi:hypothetical protein